MSTAKSVIMGTALATAMALGSGAAIAQSSDSTMSIVDTVKLLESEGYSNIESIEREWGHYDVEATDPNGARVEVKVDSASGKIVRSEPDD